jgi:multiple sugar transport system ATP-binding protein
VRVDRAALPRPLNASEGAVADLELINVSRTYTSRRQTTHAVRDLSLSAIDHEVVVLVGPSGCGKTTTLRLIAGLEELTSGSIRIGGRSADKLPPKARDVAMVFQNYALYPHMTVYDNLAFGLRMRRTPRGEVDRRVGEAARLLGIEHLIRRKPAALSGGERQRVAVGRAIVREPNVFLFDEPLSNLDPQLRYQMRGDLKGLLSGLGRTTIYVTHDQEEALTMGHRVAVMRAGRLAQCASPDEVYNRPATRFVASFFGRPTMNFLDGLLRRAGDGCVFEHVAGELPLPPSTRGALNGDESRRVVLGIRPEHVRLGPHEGEPSGGARPLAVDEGGGSRGDAPSGRVSARVQALSFLGDALHVTLDSPFGTLVARVSSEERAAVGDAVEAVFPTNRIHYFDDVEGNRL